MPHDRRRHERYDLDAGVEIWSGDVKGQKISLTGDCLNISEAGVMIRVPQAIPVLSQVVFRITRLDFEGTGTVRHCGNGGDYCMVGVEFDGGLRYVASLA